MTARDGGSGERGRVTSGSGAGSPGRERVRRVAAAVGLLILVAGAVYGGDFLDVREELLGLPTPRPPAAGRSAEGPSPSDGGRGVSPGRTLIRSNPWWQEVTTLEGTAGPGSRTVSVDEGALQWRVEWRCTSGTLEVADGERAAPLVAAECPGSGTAYGVGTGPVDLHVVAGGPWQLRVDQQVEVPLEEPPLAAMGAPGARRIATGDVYGIDQTGRGRIEVHRLPGGSSALRLEGFFVTPDVDLELRLSPLEAPRTTKAYLSAPSVLVHRLTVTAGSFNVEVPDRIDPGGYGSLVVWCPPVQSAYAAATLTEPR